MMISRKPIFHTKASPMKAVEDRRRHEERHNENIQVSLCGFVALCETGLFSILSKKGKLKVTDE